MNIIEYHKGQLIGSYGIKYNKETVLKNKHRRAFFDCYCGKVFDALIGNIKSDNVKSCGCLKGDRGMGLHPRKRKITQNTGERYIKNRKGTEQRVNDSFIVNIPFNNKIIYVGTYKTLELAIEARDEYILSKPELANRDIYLDSNK